MSKEVLTTNNAIDFASREVIATLKATVAQGLTDPEFALFAEHCKGTGLNPFKREVWAIKAGGRLQIMTGLQGYLSIANSHTQFDGMEVEVDSDENPTKAIARVYRKDRRIPAEGVALMKEYRKETPIWRQMPRVMLTKVAKSIALREAFPQELNGTYTAEEMPAEFEQAGQGTAPAKQPTVFIAEPPPALEAESQAAPLMRFQYDLSALDPAKLPAAAKLLKAAGAQSDDELLMLWESPKQITKLEKYEVRA
jgi:phage recombination protein Bet